MSLVDPQTTERATVYLTPQNKKRLSQLRKGEKTKKLNEALDKAFEEEERKKAAEAFMEKVRKIKPVPVKIPSVEIVRAIREGREHELDDYQSSDS